jgi:acid-sensing ion channel, other
MAKTITWRKVKDLFFDYSIHSTVHSVSYITEKGRSRFEKVWWILVFFVSVLFCGKLTFNAWNLNPIIISFTDKPTPIWQIPFPAVTICPKIYAQSKDINLTHLVTRIYTKELLIDDLTEEE